MLNVTSHIFTENLRTMV